MKLLLILMMSIALFSGCSSEVSCDGNVCYHNENKQYLIEDDATISVAVENELLGEALVQLWNETYPNHQNTVSYVVQNNYDGKTFLNSSSDITLIYASEAAKLNEYLLEIDNRVKNEIKENSVDQYGDALNRNGFYFIPMYASGWMFSSNYTMLESLGVDMSDLNEDGLIDALDTFEKINVWQQTQSQPIIFNEKEVATIFNFNFDDEYLTQTLLSFGGFTPFESYLASDPGFDSKDFLVNLNDLASLGQMQWLYPNETEFVFNPEDTRQEFSKWNSEFYMRDSNSVFNFVHSTMHYAGYEEQTNQNYYFSALPTFNGIQPLTSVQSVGYVINKDTPYINAVLELLSLIRSNEGLQLFASHSEQPLLVNHLDENVELEFKDENTKQISYAMMYGFEESMVAYELDSSVAGWDMFKETAIMDTMIEVFYQKLTPVDAQTKIIELSDTWMDPYVEADEEANEK